MRKEQQKLIDKGIAKGFIQEAVDLLKDESMTIKELKELYHYLMISGDCQREIVKDFPAVREMMRNIANTYGRDCYISNDLSRTQELFDFLNDNISEDMLNQSLVSRYTYARVIRVMAAAKNKNNEYILSWQQIKLLMKYIDDEVLFSPDERIKMLFDAISELDIMDFDTIILIFDVYAKSGRTSYSPIFNESKTYINFVKRILKYRDLKIDSDLMIEYEKCFLESNPDKVYLDVLQRSFPDIKKFIKGLKAEKKTYKKEVGVSINDSCKENCIYVFDKEKLKPYINFAKEMSADIKIPRNTEKSILNAEVPLTRITWELSLSGISFKIMYFSLINIYKINNRIEIKEYQQSLTNQYEYLINTDAHIYSKYKSRWIPMLLKNLLKNVKCYDFDNHKSEDRETILFQLLNFFIGQFIKSKRYAWKDIVPYFGLNYQVVNMPKLTLNEISDAYSINDAMRKHYKKAGFMNWNKGDLRVGMRIMKALPMVDDKSKNILLQMKYLTEDEYIKKYCSNPAINPETTSSFLSSVLLNHLDAVTKDAAKKIDPYREANQVALMIVNDYVTMCIQLRQKVSLTFKSFNKVKTAHDDLAICIREMGTPEIKIPKNSKFNALREILPDNMEWIKSRKRIVEEGYNMHHCVASYASKVNKDNCAIYSFVDEETEERYTVEYCMNKNGKYYISQIYGKYNKYPPESVVEYAKSFVA